MDNLELKTIKLAKSYGAQKADAPAMTSKDLRRLSAIALYLRRLQKTLRMNAHFDPRVLNSALTTALNGLQPYASTGWRIPQIIVLLKKTRDTADTSGYNSTLDRIGLAIGTLEDFVKSWNPGR